MIQLCYAGDLLTLLNVSSDEKILPTTYGELRPPLGKHRLKVGLFIYYKFNMQDEVEPIPNLEVEWSKTKRVGCHMS
jgi:hypothetical protein